MASNLATPAALARGRDLVSQRVLAGLAYLGGAALLAGSAARHVFERAPGAPRLRSEWVRQCDWLLCAGVPLVALVHIGLGSFLAMQAFYGATFLEAVGPVVGVGLFRNVAPLMTGFVLAGLLAARVTPDLASQATPERQAGDAVDPSRRGGRPAIRVEGLLDRPDPLRLAAARICAAMLAGPILAVWGASVGTTIGWLVSLQVLRVPTTVFVMKCFEMVWGRDILSLVLKGACFGFSAALFSCFEIVRGTTSPGLAAVRAACLGGLGILLFNSAFYVFFYMAGPPFGTTVLKPPVS